MRKHYFEARLTRVACPRDEHRHSGKIAASEMIIFDCAEIDFRQRLQNIFCRFTLNGKQRSLFRKVTKLHIESRSKFGEPRPVLLHRAGVDDNVVVIWLQVIYDKIVNDTGTVVWKAAILRLSRHEGCDIVRCNSLEKFERVGAADIELSHM